MAQIEARGHNKYLVRVFLGRDANGRRSYHSKTITGRKDARRYAREKERARDLGLPLEPVNVTVNEFLDRWLAYCKEHVRERTHFWYNDLMTRYVRPKLGARRLDQLQPLDVQTLYTELLQRGLAGRTARHVHARLVTALNQAMRWRILAQNPAALVRPPKIVKREMYFLSPDEAARFLAAAKEDSHGLLLAFALATGLRPEEFLALQWKDLELDRRDRGVAHVRRSVQLVPGGSWEWGELKSRSSRRDVYFPLPLARELAKHRIRQNELRLRVGRSYADNDLVWATKLGTPLDRKSLVDRHFKPTLRRAKLPEAIRLYDLRHSYVTLSLLSGVKPKVVSEQAGHSSVAFTLDNYAHVLPEEREGASDRLEKLLFSGVGAP